jgi:hypothetical protein
MTQNLKMTQDKDLSLAIECDGESGRDRAFESGIVFERAKLCGCMVPFQYPDEARPSRHMIQGGKTNGVEWSGRRKSLADSPGVTAVAQRFLTLDRGLEEPSGARLAHSCVGRAQGPSRRVHPRPGFQRNLRKEIRACHSVMLAG